MKKRLPCGEAAFMFVTLSAYGFFAEVGIPSLVRPAFVIAMRFVAFGPSSTMTFMFRKVPGGTSLGGR